MAKLVLISEQRVGNRLEIEAPLSEEIFLSEINHNGGIDMVYMESFLEKKEALTLFCALKGCSIDKILYSIEHDDDKRRYIFYVEEGKKIILSTFLKNYISPEYKNIKTKIIARTMVYNSNFELVRKE